MNVHSEYRRLRAKGWRAIDALRSAKIRAAFAELDGDLVKLECEVDDCMSADDLCGEECPPTERKEILARAERDGVWVLVAYARPNKCAPWVYVDAVGGFIGDDYEDSGYDDDLRSAALDALDDYNGDGAQALAERATYAAGGA